MAWQCGMGIALLMNKNCSWVSVLGRNHEVPLSINVPDNNKSGGDAMYFMNICTWDPKDETEIRERRERWKWPDEVNVVFEFVDLQGGRVINVLDTDAKGLIASRSAWLDMVKFETFPVYPIGTSKALLKK